VALSGSEEGNFLETGVLPGGARPYSESTARQVDQAVRRIIDECYGRALELLRQHRPRLEALTDALLREDSLSEAQMRAATGLDAQRHPPHEIALER
jgi:cell division protease FtsH